MPAPSKILVMHQGAIGDLVLSLPALACLRRAFPDAHLHMMGRPVTLSLVHRRYYAHSISSVDRACVASLYRSDGRIDAEMLREISRFDTVVVFGGPRQERLVENIRRVQACSVLRIDCFPEGREHVVDFQLRGLRQHGICADTCLPALCVRDEDRTGADRLLAQAGLATGPDPIVVVHPGSGSPEKNWPLERLAGFLQRLARQLPCRFLIVLGPAESRLAGRLRRELAPVPHSVLMAPELPVLGALMRQCALYTGNDSGITHLAAASGCATLAVFGPMDPLVWGPRGQRVRILTGGRGGGCWSWPTPDAALDVALALLRGCGGRAA